MIKIIGEKIYLRDHIEEDFEFYHSWRSNSQVMKFLDWGSDNVGDSRESFNEALKESNPTSRTKFFFAIINKTTSHKIARNRVYSAKERQFILAVTSHV